MKDNIGRKGTEKEKRNSVHILANGIGTRISAASKLVGTRKSAALAAQVSTDSLQRYIREEVQPPFEAMVGLCNAAGVSLEWLATGVDPQNSKDVREEKGRYQLGSQEYDELMDDIKLVAVELEKFLKNNQLQIEDPEAKAKLIAMTVDYVHTRDKSRADEPVSAQIVRLMKYAS
ncbi:MAG: hypothetical protein RPT95_10485 [Candidatus Sedimenticola sp. (ex Thyasira tokunagai)]